MKATGNRTAKVRKAVLAAFAALLLGLALAPSGANAAKVDNPSPPNFRAEISGGFLEVVGTSGTALGIPMDFSEFDLPNPAFSGTVTTNANGYGVITVPNSTYVNCVAAQTPVNGGICFPPIPVNVDDIAVTVRIQPVAGFTGMIDPLSGIVHMTMPLRLKIEGAALGIDLGNSCYVGSSGSPITLATRTHVGAFPTTPTPPAQNVAVANLIADNAGWIAGEPYTDEAGVWPEAPVAVPGFPTDGSGGKPTAAQVLVAPLTSFIERGAGSWRGVDETYNAPAAEGCGLATSQLNSTLGLPSQGNNTAVTDFRFTSFPQRTDPANAIVNKAVKSRFTAPGVSASPWLTTQTPTAVSAQNVQLDASTSYFKVGGHATERYSFDFGTGTFGAWTTNPVANFTAPTISEGSPPITLPIRVRIKDTGGDMDIAQRTLRVVPATDISLDTKASSVAGDGKLRAGSSGHVTFDVKNNSANDASSLPLTLTASVPTGVSITSFNSPGAWNCTNDASNISCTLPASGLAAGATSQFDATVDVATNAANPAQINANVAMAGDPSPANNTDNLAAPVVKTDLAVDVSHSDQLVANGWFPYTVDVENVGDGVTVGGSTVGVSLPSGFTYRSEGSGGFGWSCAPSDPQNISCGRSAEIAGNDSAPPITIWARIDRTTPAENRTVSATVSTQGDIGAFSGADNDDDTDLVHVLNDLAADVSVAGAFTVGDPGTITYSVTNESVVPGTVATSIDSALPAGLTVTAVDGAGWDCSATVLDSDQIQCEHAAGISDGATTGEVTATVAVAQAAYPGVSVPVTLTNTEDAFSPNNEDAADVPVRRLDLAIEKIAVKPFNVGIEGRYRLNVTNVGDAITVGDITVTDTLPAGLKLKGVSGAGWDCSDSTVGGADVICVMENTLGGGIQAAPIEVRVDVLDEAAEAGTVINTAYVDTARDTRGVPEDAAIEANNTSSVSTTAVAVDLSIESRHQGAFRVGTDDVYSLDIRNVGFFGTDPGESITVTDNLPDGIVPDVDNIEATRPGWECTENAGDVTCTLEAPDALSSAMEPESSVTIDIPVHITDAAADNSDNIAEVSTARDANPALSPNNIATDPTEVRRIDVSVAGEVSIAPRAGGIGELSITVHNGGSAPTVEPTTVVMPLATGVSFRPTGSTTAGWSCSSTGVATQVTCVRSQSIAAGADAPALKLRTNVGNTAPASWDTGLEVATNGEPDTRLADNEATVAQTLETIDLAITKSHDPAAVRAGKRGSFKIHVENVGNQASVASYRVQDPVNPTFQNVSASGPGWTCSVAGDAVDCTRTASLPAGAPAPDITVGFDIPGTASGSKDSVATVSSTDDPFTANNSASDPISVVATADVTVSIDQPSTMRVGDTVGITYTVRNIGTDSTAGAPSVKLNVSVSEGLAPVGNAGDGDWNCDPVPAVGLNPAYLDCEYGGTLAPGADTTMVGQFDVVPTSDSNTQSLAVASTPGDVNPSNNYANATSSLSGVDLEATVAAAGTSTEHMEAGVTATRVVTVKNVGTSSTTGPTSVSVDLPDGVQWDSDVGQGTSGWNCGQIARKVTCTRGEQLTADQTAPALNLGLRASRSNAPEVGISYVVSTTGDENQSNDSANRTEEVRFNPETVITSGPGNGTSKSASAEFNSPDSGVTFECRVDSNPFEACTSPYSVEGLSIGQHSISVRAVNEFGMADDSPAVTSWEVLSIPKTGPKVPVTLESTGGTLSLASLGAVDLPEDQVKLEGDLFTDNGGVTIPASGVSFAPVTQTIEDVLGPGSVVGITINITATADSDGLLPNGGGDSSFVLPVQADIVASLGGSPLLPEGTECALKPVTFDLAGTYNESAGTVHLEQDNVAFPEITGCGPFKVTIDSLLELPRNDIEMALDFKVTKGAAECEPPLVGTPPDCVQPPEQKPKLAKVVVKGPKKVKSGKKFALKASVKNNGDATASNVKVCVQTPKRLIAGKAKRCRTVKTIAAGKTATVTFRLKAKKAGKKARKRTRAKFTVTAPTGDGSKTGKHRGHVTVLK